MQTCTMPTELKLGLEAAIMLDFRIAGTCYAYFIPIQSALNKKGDLLEHSGLQGHTPIQGISRMPEPMHALIHPAASLKGEHFWRVAMCTCEAVGPKTSSNVKVLRFPFEVVSCTPDLMESPARPHAPCQSMPF
jgi:hypothetical protein